MAVQQLTQPIINPIAAFDASRAQTITFVVIGGAQVIGNRLVVTNNQTGEIIYNKFQSNMKLEHILPANTLTNGEYYNAVIYTISSANKESTPSRAVPFYCYSEPQLVINNIPTSETIENGTYTFTGEYLQQENESLNSYQFTLYDSNKEILTQTDLIYYETDNSLSYTFRGMSNDTAYYIELSGETVNNTKITSGLVYFTVRYIQPASFAICDLVNNCQDGYIQISSNIVAIDGKSYPVPPIYIDDKEVDLTHFDGSYVEWDTGFRILSDFTLRAWGRSFEPYQDIITLSNDLNTEGNPNHIEMKWMIGDVIKNLPTYSSISGRNINLSNQEVSPIENLIIKGNTVQDGTPTIDVPVKLYGVGDIKNLINVANFNVSYNQQYFETTNTGFLLEPNYLYTLSFNYVINSETTDVYFSIGYGTTEYSVDIASNIQYTTQMDGKNKVSFIVPASIPANNYLWVKFAQTIILADVDVDISNIQLEKGELATTYQVPNVYEIYPTCSNKNLYQYDSPLYLIDENSTYTKIANGYHIDVAIENEDSYLSIGCRNVLNSGDTYTISYAQLGQFKDFKLYTTNKDSQERVSEIPITNNSFTAPNGLYDLQLVFSVDSSSESNYIEIWNIQIEANNIISEYEPHLQNKGVLGLGEPLNGIGNYQDIICVKSPNLLNSETQSAVVEGNTNYYLNQAGNTLYYLWYYNEDNNLITFVDEQGEEQHGVSLISGNFITQSNCVKIVITKSNEPKAQDVGQDELINNQVIISKGNTSTLYYPYAIEPSLIRYFGSKTLNGRENWILDTTVSNQTNTLFFSVQNAQTSLDNNIINCMSDILVGKSYNDLTSNDTEGIALTSNDSGKICVRILKSRGVSDLASFKTFLGTHNINGVFRLKDIVVEALNQENANAIENLNTYVPTTNVYINNEILGNISFDYISGHSEQQTRNAYILLKCWSTHPTPYICHSNYIDIPSDKDNVFIWVRRKNNLFDVKIENLFDYGSGDTPIDDTKPVVSLEIEDDNVTSSTIPITAHVLDDSGLKTVRFSKNNGQSWDEIIAVDGLSTTNEYTFTDLKASTTYTIRVEAIDMSGNIGGISRQVTTKS